MLLLPTTDNESAPLAEETILDRSPLFYGEDKVLKIKYNGKMQPLSAVPDYKNIKKTIHDDIGLKDDILIKSSVVTPEVGATPVKTIKLFDSSTKNTIIILMNYDPNRIQNLSGQLFRNCQTYPSSYWINITSDGNYFIKGSSTEEIDAKIVKVTYNDLPYIGIKYSSAEQSEFYFHGYDSRFGSLIDVKEYQDSTVQVQEI